MLVHHQIIVFFTNLEKIDNIWLKLKEHVGLEILVNGLFGLFEK